MLALLAIGAFVSYFLFQQVNLSSGLLAMEGILLLGGVWLYREIRQSKWVEKAAITERSRLVEPLLPIIEKLGEKYSSRFPQMCLWRAAQGNERATGDWNAEDLRQIKGVVSDLLGRLRGDVDSYVSVDRAINWSARIAVLCVIIFGIAAAITHAWYFETAAIWIPSIVAALHGYSSQKRLLQQQTLGYAVLQEVELLHRQIHLLIGKATEVPETSAERSELEEYLRLICLSIGKLTQEKMRSALSEMPHVPV